MRIEEAIKILKDGRENLYGALDKSVPYEQQHTLVALDMAIKSLETIQRIDDVLYVEGMISEIDILDEIMEALSEFKYDCGVDE